MKSTRPLLCLLLLPALPAQGDPTPGAERIAATVSNRAAWPFDHVLYDVGIDGRLWACGASWKASFGADGFTFVPRFGADAPSSAVNFQLGAVRVAGHEVPLLRTDATTTRAGDVVSFARGAVTESYRLALDQVEQTFAIDAGPGDVEVELTVATDLVERAEQPGLQFANAHGEVGYSDAFVVDGDTRTPIATRWDGHHLVLRVEAAQRGSGPLVIDPILNTRSASTSGLIPSVDVAYDASMQRYLMVWDLAVSATDTDVFSEQFDALGDPVLASGAAVEISGLLARRPRTANLAVAHRHLVAFELADPNFGNRFMIYSRTFDAATSLVGPYERLSNPFLPGDNLFPEVGADSGTDPATSHDWLVVWQNKVSTSDANVHGRAVLDNGTARHAWVLVIEDGVNTFNEPPQVSRSNGNGVVPFPMWLVVYSRVVPQSNSQIFARSLDLGFNLGSERTIGNIVFNQRNPQVSSPIAAANATAFLITYEQLAAASALGAVSYFGPSLSGGTNLDLTAQFGLSGAGLRCESDGVRFVFVSRNPATNDRLLTTAMLDSAGFLVLQDGPVPFGTTPRDPEITACRSSGGPLARYGVAWIEGTIGLVPKLTVYGGHHGGNGIVVQNTGCHGLGLQHAGTPVLGDTLQFTVTAGGDIPGFAFGVAAANPIAFCGTCSLGLRLDLPIVVDFGSTSFSVSIPPVAELVGSSFGVQGLGLGAWPCFNLRFSNTVQFTIQ